MKPSMHKALKKDKVGRLARRFSAACPPKLRHDFENEAEGEHKLVIFSLRGAIRLISSTAEL